jgi:GNAT superfamily N-acetyltransferase
MSDCLANSDESIRSRLLRGREPMLLHWPSQSSVTADKMSTHRLTIRPASPEDAPILLGMIRELADYERLTHEVVATERELRKSLFGSRSSTSALMGYEGTEPVAYAVYFHNFSTFLGRTGLYLEDLFVRPPYRRRGYGRQMLSELARIALKEGCGRFEWTVLAWNEPAIRFYESLGAQVLPDWRVCRVTGDALKNLSAADG